MSDTIKVQLLDSIKTAIEALTGVGSVFQNPAMPTIRDHAVYPIVFMFDSDEKKTHRNRVSSCLFNLQIEIWANGEDWAKTAENLGGLIENTIMNMHPFQAIIESSSDDKDYPQPELEGISIWQFRVLYHHDYGNPFSQTISI
jgi:hypothetical protein